MLDRAEAAQILEIVDVDMPVVDLAAALPQQIPDHVLARPLGAADGGYRDKIACGRKLRIETGIDGIEDFPLDIANIHRAIVPILCCIAKTAPARSNHTLPGIAEVLDRFQNRARAHTLPAKIRDPWRHRMPANRNVLYLIIGALIVAVGVLGYNLYQTKKEPEGLQINVGPSGLKIQSK